MTAFNGLRTHVVNRLGKLIESNPEIAGTINYQNQPNFNPPQDKPWARLNIRSIGSRMAGFGGEQPCTRAAGNIVFQCYVKRKKGSTEVFEMADKLGAHFAYFTIGGLECRDARFVEVGESGDWYQINVMISFLYDY